MSAFVLEGNIEYSENLDFVRYKGEGKNEKGGNGACEIPS